jgi:hypothetical protein
MGRRKPYRPPPSLNVEAPEPSVYQPDTEWLEPVTRTCVREVCKKKFVVTAPNQRACPECQDPHEQERRHTYYLEIESADGRKRVNELHAIARAKRCPPKIEQCRICGKDFVKLRSKVTCDDPECRKRNRINTRGKYDDNYRDEINAGRREKRAADTEWRDAVNKRRRVKRA